MTRRAKPASRIITRVIFLLDSMEKTIAEVPPLVGFAAYFPLPFRVMIVVSLGLFLFGTNLTLLLRSGIDVESLFYPSSHATSTSRQHDTLAQPLYAVALSAMCISTVGITAFWTLTRDTNLTILDYRWLPSLLFIAACAVVFSPIRLYAHERYRFLQVIKRVLVGGIDSTDRFLDVVVTDILTSYAKVFGDIVTTICLLFSSTGLTYLDAKDHCTRNLLIPVAIAAPYMMRFRQCLIDYRRTGSRTHLANALKYCTAFPVILISMIQLRRTEAAGGEVGTPNTSSISDGRLYQIWVLSCLINTGYSFWWDVTKDWDLSLLTTTSASPVILTDSHLLERPEPEHYGLRQKLTFSPNIYYIAIVVDLLLRMLWSLKLSPHLHGLVEYESGIFLMECLEVGRRWMWIFLRIETEHHRATHNEGSIALTELGGVAFTKNSMGKFVQD